MLSGSKLVGCLSSPEEGRNEGFGGLLVFCSWRTVKKKDIKGSLGCFKLSSLCGAVKEIGGVFWFSVASPDSGVAAGNQKNFTTSFRVK